eukprot:TRINITY_DN72905_c0_g1_i1.p2 TRINITY_DN72905_c0_g1~~TRINITY_DN72905_c0_g1_i1.p2  ORF type:complete len:110 (+),score=2.48 TRINITY_DN72905_c0_g1_i1:174-503(+)
MPSTASEQPTLPTLATTCFPTRLTRWNDAYIFVSSDHPTLGEGLVPRIPMLVTVSLPHTPMFRLTVTLPPVPHHLLFALPLVVALPIFSPSAGPAGRESDIPIIPTGLK